MSFLIKGRSVAVVKEVTYGAAAPTFTNTDYVDYTAADVTPDIEKIDRAVLRDSLLNLESLQGQETSSGNITVEVSGAVAGKVNGELLYENGIGKKVAQTTATTVATGTSATKFSVTSAVGLTVGQAIKVTLTTGAEYSVITVVSGTDITVSPALSAIPGAADAVQGLLSFLLPKPKDTVTSLAVRENLKPTSGNNIDYDYLGVMVSDVSFDFPVGGISTAAFSVGGAGFTSTTPGSTPTTPCTLHTPVIGKNASFSAMGNTYEAKDVSFSIGTEIFDVNAITTDGLADKIVTAKTVTGSFSVMYNGTANFDLFKAGTKGAASLLLKDGGKTSPVITGFFMPNIKLTSVSRTEDGGIFYDNIEFEVLSPDCDVTTEKALTVFFA